MSVPVVLSASTAVVVIVFAATSLAAVVSMSMRAVVAAVVLLSAVVVAAVVLSVGLTSVVMRLASCGSCRPRASTSTYDKSQKQPTCDRTQEQLTSVK